MEVVERVDADAPGRQLLADGAVRQDHRAPTLVGRQLGPSPLSPPARRRVEDGPATVGQGDGLHDGEAQAGPPRSRDRPGSAR